MLRKLLTRAAVVLTGFTLLTFVHSTPSQAVEPDCKTVSADLVRPDSGLSGDWATDTFHRSAKVCHLPVVAEKTLVPVQSWHYSVEVKDAGTFTTKGVKSFTGATMKPDVTGKFHGSLGADLSYRGSFDAPKDWGLWLGTSPGNSYGTSDWVKHLWSDGYVPGKSEWGWKYETCNEWLLNASAGNHGDITGLSKAPCYQVAFVDKCDGVLVTLGNQAPSDSTVIVYYVNGVKYEVKGGSPATVITVHAADVVVKSRGHLDWRHHYVRPTCATPTATPTVPTVPVDQGGSLPVTGPAVPGLLIGGLSLLALGGIGIYLARRRRTRFTA